MMRNKSKIIKYFWKKKKKDLKKRTFLCCIKCEDYTENMDTEKDSRSSLIYILYVKLEASVCDILPVFKLCVCM